MLQRRWPPYATLASSYSLSQSTERIRHDCKQADQYQNAGEREKRSLKGDEKIEDRFG